MIVTKLSGGLGNQMFQYAAGYSFAKRNRVDLALDLSGYYQQSNDTVRQYGLAVFNISASVAEESKVKGFLSVTNLSYLDRVINKFKLNPRLIRETEVFVFHQLKKINPKVDYYLEGYWQNEKYFNEERQGLLKEFSLLSDDSETLQALQKTVTACQSVAIHIRRGDYLDSMYRPQEDSKCIFFGLDYYRQAVLEIKKRFKQPLWLIFSDDTAWVKANIKDLGLTALDELIFVDDHNLKDYEELLLMSQCHYQIIANSTFSWWGAWLNQHEDKFVIGPKKWLKGGSFNTDDLLLKDWMTI